MGISKGGLTTRFAKCFKRHSLRGGRKEISCSHSVKLTFMHVDERIKQIAEIFSYFHIPDKETVLTPWRVVNMHMSDTIGGYCFYD